MTRIAYLDCVTGIAGDMFLGALVDSGVPLEYLIEQLKGLKIDHEYKLSQEKVQRNGQQATKVHVKLLTEDSHKNHHHHHHHTPARHLPEIEGMIQQANLPPRVTQWSLDIFRQLAVAEGAVHGVAPEKVHFHEVGATDAIVDIVGTCIGLDYLNIETLYCSALPTGGGTVRAAHGRLPVPVPAVLKLWESRQVPIYSNKIDKELVTPTGAAIAVTLVKSFGEPPNMILEKVGLGAGSQELSLPNILRLWIGEKVTEKKTIMST
ncbi:MAG: nickel pincer cofactor biosynthesis protein LarC [Crocosphaera sp.]|nr:nickel pincer cofactor biosynthesis protein LarC [Crocosphaera sp.]